MSHLGLTLEALGQEPVAQHALEPGGFAHVGRLVENELCLPVETISRRHAKLFARDGAWFLVDLGSKAGTELNGVPLAPHRPTPLNHADSIAFGPCDYRVSIGTREAVIAAPLVDDTAESRTRLSHEPALKDDYANQRLTLLSEVIERFVAVPDEAALYEVALQTAIDGSGFARAAFLRPIGTSSDVELVAQALRDSSDPTSFSFSRSLVRQAAAGDIVMMRGSDDAQVVTGQSIVQLQIHSALCAPMFFGDTIEGFLYLDARGEEQAIAPDAASFCRLLSRAFALALSSIRRSELERRQQQLQADLQAARHVQQVIMPAPSGTVGLLDYALRTVPGMVVAGDLFDIFTLDNERTIMLLGDVAGHGIDSALVMALGQSFLHATLSTTGDLCSSVNELNRYLADRTDEGRFVTLWVGMFHADGTLEYVDAGHGHGAFIDPDGSIRPFDPSPNIPIGILDDHQFTSVTCQAKPDSRVFVYSDGVIEQTNAEGDAYGRERLLERLQGRRAAHDEVNAMFDDVAQFAANVPWSDDTTMVSVRVTN
ncbi:MAG: SpoIIE family protein phosphatase [Planctomycetota bacterium]